jgi:hypothetical protein
MLREMILYYNGNPDEPDNSDGPNRNIVYNGGMEV